MLLLSAFDIACVDVRVTSRGVKLQLQNVCLLHKLKTFTTPLKLIQTRRHLMIHRISKQRFVSKQYWLTVTPSVSSSKQHWHVVACLPWTFLTPLSCKWSACSFALPLDILRVLWPFKFATAHFDIWVWNEDLTTSLCSFARAMAWYAISSIDAAVILPYRVSVIVFYHSEHM
jgi:hypothetical protein